MNLFVDMKRLGISLINSSVCLEFNDKNLYFAAVLFQFDEASFKTQVTFYTV